MQRRVDRSGKALDLSLTALKGSYDIIMTFPEPLCVRSLVIQHKKGNVKLQNLDLQQSFVLRSRSNRGNRRA